MTPHFSSDQRVAAALPALIDHLDKIAASHRLFRQSVLRTIPELSGPLRDHAAVVEAAMEGERSLLVPPRFKGWDYDLQPPWPWNQPRRETPLGEWLKARRSVRGDEYRQPSPSNEATRDDDEDTFRPDPVPGLGRKP